MNNKPKIKVDNAIILAAGYGSRLIPLTYELPKGLVMIKGQSMVERQIIQLNEVGIEDITIIVGYMKEKFYYLKEKYSVNILYCADYMTKNNMFTLYLARNLLKNTYILISDYYIINNIYKKYEYNSWYSTVKMLGETDEWCLNIDDNDRIQNVTIGGSNSWVMHGPAFFTRDFSNKFIKLLEQYNVKDNTDDFFWENVLINHLDVLEIYANYKNSDNLYEFDSLEEIRAFDTSYNFNANCSIMNIVAQVFNVEQYNIVSIEPVKLGMTNKSFTFDIMNKKYICRVPGLGTEKLINRKNEGQNIEVIKYLNISENVIFFDPDTGIKISEYLTESRRINLDNMNEVKRSISLIKRLHNAKLDVSHEFNLEERILYYESICKKNMVIFSDEYHKLRMNIFKLLEHVNNMSKITTLSHIDSMFENILVLPTGELKLIDWEYAGMCDPLIDISMFALHAGYTDTELEKIAYYYFDSIPGHNELIRIKSYMALGAFLWYLWSRYKQSEGVNFDQYQARMYSTAIHYYETTMILINKSNISQ